MLETVKKVVASKAFKELLRVLVALLAGYAGSGCGVLPPPNAAQLDVFECQLAALEEVVPAEAAEDLVMALRADNSDYVVAQLLRLGIRWESIEALADAYNACSAPAALEPAEPDPLDGGVPGPQLLRL